MDEQSSRRCIVAKDRRGARGELADLVTGVPPLLYDSTPAWGI